MIFKQMTMYAVTPDKAESVAKQINERVGIVFPNMTRQVYVNDPKYSFGEYNVCLKVVAKSATDLLEFTILHMWNTKSNEFKNAVPQIPGKPPIWSTETGRPKDDVILQSLFKKANTACE